MSNPYIKLEIVNKEKKVGTWIEAHKLVEIAKALDRRNLSLQKEVIRVYEICMDCKFPSEKIKEKRRVT